MVSLCRPVEAPQAVVYRYGRAAQVELAAAGGAGPQPTAFWRENAPLIGGGETRVGFERGSYEYRIYSKVQAKGAQGEPDFEDGVIVLRRGRVVRKMVCDDGGEGFREKIDWLPPRDGR